VADTGRKAGLDLLYYMLLDPLAMQITCIDQAMETILVASINRTGPLGPLVFSFARESQHPQSRWVPMLLQCDAMLPSDKLTVGAEPPSSHKLKRKQSSQPNAEPPRQDKGSPYICESASTSRAAS